MIRWSLAWVVITVVAPGDLPSGRQDDPRKIDRLIASLDSDSVDEREAAHRALIELGGRALATLKAAVGKATPEQRIRLAEIIRELELRLEEEALKRLGLPAWPARAIPDFTKRFQSKDEAVVLDVLQRISGTMPDTDGEASLRKSGGFKLKDHEVEPVVRSVLRRARGTPLKLAALRLVTARNPGLRETLVRLASDPDPQVRRTVFHLADDIPLAGAEEAIASWLTEGTNAEKLAAIDALARMETKRAREMAQAGLLDPSPKVRERATSSLAGSGAKVAIPAIRRLLKDPDGAVRKSAVSALRSLRAFGALEDILDLRRDPDPAVRRGVMQVVGHWKGPRSQAAVLEALDRPGDGTVFPRAIKIAARFGMMQAIPKLMKILKTGERSTAEAAARALAALGSAAVEEKLLRLARAAEGDLRRRALVGLASRPSPKLIPVFVEALKSPDDSLHRAAAGALAETRGEKAKNALRAALTDASLKKTVLDALARSRNSQTVSLIVPFLDDPDSLMLLKAIKVVDRHHVAEAAPALEKLLTHPSDEVAGKAVAALYSATGVRALPALWKVLDRSTPKVREVIWNHIARNPGGTAVKTMIERFKEAPAGRRRHRLIDILARHVSKESTAFLAHLLEVGEEPWRRQAAQALARRGDERGVKAVRETLLRSKDFGERLTAASILVEGSDASEEAIKVLVEGARNRQVDAVRPLAELRRPEARPLLLEKLKEHYWFRRNDAARWMALYPAGTFDADIRKMAADKSDVVRRGAAAALTYTATHDRQALLEKLLKDVSQIVRYGAVTAFWTLRPERAPKELVDRLRDPSKEVRKAAVHALMKLDPGALKPRIETLLADPAPGVREKAVLAARNLRLPVADSILEMLLNDENDRVRRQATWAAGALGRPQMAGRLIRIMEEGPESWDRSSAAHALVELGHERGLDAMRSIRACGVPAIEGNAFIALMGRQDLASVSGTLRFVARSYPGTTETDRALFAMNAFTRRDLYRKALDTRIDLRVWAGTKREWIRKLSEAFGLPFEIDPRLPAATLERRARTQGHEMSLEWAISSMGHVLNAACVIEADRVRVLPVMEALAHWERWRQARRK